MILFPGELIVGVSNPEVVDGEGYAIEVGEGVTFLGVDVVISACRVGVDWDDG